MLNYHSLHRAFLVGIDALPFFWNAKATPSRRAPYTRAARSTCNETFLSKRKSRRDDEFNKILNTDGVSITRESWISFPLTHRVLQTPFHGVDERKFHDISRLAEEKKKKKNHALKRETFRYWWFHSSRHNEASGPRVRLCRGENWVKQSWKLVKTHFTRVIETSNVTRETVLEVSLNSQPVAVVEILRRWY